MTSREVMYAQCHLRRVAPDGSIWHSVGFIPAIHAVVGKKLRLTLGKQTHDNWEVIAAGKAFVPGRLLQEQSRDYKRMRKASDI